MNILMIDDDYLDLEGMQVLLKQLPLEISNVYTALNARTARETVQNKNIHIILCDVEMPEETGLEFARWLRVSSKTHGKLSGYLQADKPEI